MPIEYYILLSTALLGLGIIFRFSLGNYRVQLETQEKASNLSSQINSEKELNEFYKTKYILLTKKEETTHMKLKKIGLDILQLEFSYKELLILLLTKKD